MEERAPLLLGAKAEVDAMHAIVIAAVVFMMKYNFGFAFFQQIIFEVTSTMKKRKDGGFLVSLYPPALLPEVLVSHEKERIDTSILLQL